LLPLASFTASKMLNFAAFTTSLLPVISYNGLATATTVLPSNEYWQVSPPLNYSDVSYAGWNQILVEKETMVYNGTEVGRTVRSIPAVACSPLKATSTPTTQLS
jgi:hypothetical protein